MGHLRKSKQKVDGLYFENDAVGHANDLKLSLSPEGYSNKAIKTTVFADKTEKEILVRTLRLV